VLSHIQIVCKPPTFVTYIDAYVVSIGGHSFQYEQYRTDLIDICIDIDIDIDIGIDIGI
jgi:hypothetical protein